MTASVTTFTALGLDPAFSPTLAALGITEPTPVQTQAIPIPVSYTHLTLPTIYSV